MVEQDNNRFLEFMDWVREAYQCPYHPGWAMTIEAFAPLPMPKTCETLKDGVWVKVEHADNPFGVDYVLSCSATATWGAEILHPLGDPDRCGYHIHIDDLRKLFTKKGNDGEE